MYNFVNFLADLKRKDCVEMRGGCVRQCVVLVQLYLTLTEYSTAQEA
jgi:hypothetical protein